VPRPLRIEYPGAIYHVMNRGDRREAIFTDDDDHRIFCKTLTETCGRTGWQVHAWCLLGNHFHLVGETPRGNLVAGMKWLLGTYTQRFNRRHRLSGHLFQGRYKAQVIDAETPGYLRAACDYVHLNPARAGLVGKAEALENWRWSSYPQYLRKPQLRSGWLRTDRLLQRRVGVRAKYLHKLSPAQQANIDSSFE
jgi:putative transposase